jgi:hypothetical protein
MTSGASYFHRGVHRLFIFSCLRSGNNDASFNPTMKLLPTPAGDSYVALEAPSPPSSVRSPPVPAMMLRKGVTRETSVVRSTRSHKLYLLLKTCPSVGLSLFSFQL